MEIRKMNEEQLLDYLIGVLRWLTREKKFQPQYRYNDSVEFEAIKARLSELKISSLEVEAIMMVLDHELKEANEIEGFSMKSGEEARLYLRLLEIYTDMKTLKAADPSYYYDNENEYDELMSAMCRLGTTDQDIVLIMTILHHNIVMATLRKNQSCLEEARRDINLVLNGYVLGKMKKTK